MPGPLTLLTLPAELRDNIWRKAFTVEPLAHYSPWNRDRQANRVPISHDPSKAHTTSVLAALLTCRQLHNEAWTLFYTENLLSFSSPEALFKFLTTIRTPQREHVRAIHVASLGVHWSSLNSEKAFSLLPLCHNLQEVYIDFDKTLIVRSEFFQYDGPPTMPSVFAKSHKDPTYDYRPSSEWCQWVQGEDIARLQRTIQTLENLHGLREFRVRMDLWLNLKRTKPYVEMVQGQVVDRFWSSKEELDWPLKDIEHLCTQTKQLYQKVKQPRVLVKTRYERAIEDARIDQKRRTCEDASEPSREKNLKISKRNIDLTDEEEEF